MDEFKSYFAGQAETWEHQALLRARPVAGDRAFGAAFCHAIQDLIYRDADKAMLARDIVMMRKRMEEEVGKESAAHYNIKQGAGGLVDIEFITQYLQLRHGRQHRRVRVPGTYNALRSLRKERLLEEDDYRILLRAYLFIRLLESRMRIVSNQVTSDLSRDPVKLQLLARRMGYTDEAAPAGAAGQKLLADYEQLSAAVREVFERILGQQRFELFSSDVAACLRCAFHGSAQPLFQLLSISVPYRFIV
jgi:glutamate-ammonia-ligase adenylyltransferase